MKKHTSKITAKSIEQSGLSEGYKAIAEYIWNGFDEGASYVNINYEGNEVGYLQELSIEDNGTGIDFSDLENTFGKFQDSQKAKTFAKTGFVKGKKGKGRFAFTTFAHTATWDTVFEKEGKHLQYQIKINKSNSQDYETSDDRKIVSIKCGTRVVIKNIFDLYGDQLDNDAFYEFLASEFGWFLLLNKDKDYHINLNGERLDYSIVIDDKDITDTTIIDDNFKISFVRWSKKIGDKYYFYFLDKERVERYRLHTSFNNGAIDFHHSVFVESKYFDDFKPTKEDSSTFDKNQQDGTFKALVQHLKEVVAKKEKDFIRHNKAEKLIERYRQKKIFPSFKNNAYDQVREKDLENVVKELYCAEPSIFKNLKTTQSKTLVGFLNLLLDSEERDKILTIIDGIVNLSDEERNELAKVLQKTKFTYILNLIRLLESRHTAVETLRILIYDLNKFTNERDHIQKVIENNYWLFGEKYHLVSADQNFEATLSNYLKFLEENDNKKPKIGDLNQDEKLRRPDLLICRKSDKPDHRTEDGLIEENIVVELKRPSVEIGKVQYRQIEDYMNFIISEDQFNSQLREWKFIIVGTTVDDYITGLYKSQEVKGKRFLVHAIDRCEIYAMTWDDLFKQYRNRHKNLVDQLEFKNSIKEELKAKDINFDKELSNKLTKKIA
ncbi:ATP-binding protein [Christiangramia sp. OXR-203]|uniref:ATP-binding protein n=1 Tax=Christiangramia sp. OXR-203 TaxID=3100176 RepID=UPI002AC8E26D|nr:ATP-binding protein [Christiangramia sp. OXR-203]WPY97808.1 ATP-binding protein [Christiangramia sp. OXR-203]